MIIRAQIFRTANGERLITYAVTFNGVFLCYSKCFCSAMRAVEFLTFN